MKGSTRRGDPTVSSTAPTVSVKKGRPRGPGTKGATLSLRIPAHLRAQIDAKVQETGTNVSYVVETLLTAGLTFDRLFAGAQLRPFLEMAWRAEQQLQRTLKQ